MGFIAFATLLVQDQSLRSLRRDLATLQTPVAPVPPVIATDPVAGRDIDSSLPSAAPAPAGLHHR
jgi:hypothetical protein